MSEPTPEEIARVQAHLCAQRGHFFVYHTDELVEPTGLSCNHCSKVWLVTPQETT